MNLVPYSHLDRCEAARFDRLPQAGRCNRLAGLELNGGPPRIEIDGNFADTVHAPDRALQAKGSARSCQTRHQDHRVWPYVGGWRTASQPCSRSQCDDHGHGSHFHLSDHLPAPASSDRKRRGCPLGLSIPVPVAAGMGICGPSRLGNRAGWGNIFRWRIDSDFSGKIDSRPKDRVAGAWRATPIRTWSGLRPDGSCR